MSPPDLDPSGYQKYLAADIVVGLRRVLWLSAIVTLGLILFYDRWKVVVWIETLLVSLMGTVVYRHVRGRGLYPQVARLERRVIIEAFAFMVLLVAVVLVQSHFGLWFSQNEICLSRRGQCFG